jgi:hypothetical protein
MTIDHGTWDDKCLKALYEIQKEQGAIPSISYEEYKRLVTGPKLRGANPFQGLKFRG